VADVIQLTEDNDINQLIGRPNGYVAATVLVDSRVECATAEPGVDCGATVEQWPDEGAAHKRADYIQETLASMPMLGTEWTTVKGNLLLHVTGKLKPSAAKAYEASFAG
jgi:serine/threonine protein kinase, bacterial